MMKIAVRMPFADEKIKEQLSQTAIDLGCSIKYLPDTEPTLADIADCNILFGKMPIHLLKEVKGLLWYQSPSAGVNGLTEDSVYPNNQVILTNGSGAYGVTIAEHQVMSLLMLMRGAPRYLEAQKTAQWNNLGEVQSIYGSTILIVGAGNLGSEFAKRVHAMGAYVIGIRHNGAALREGFDEMYNIREIDSILPKADVVALNLPGTGETEGIMTRKRIESLKSSAILMNVGRGNALDQDALNDALRKGTLAGAAIDVTVPEPLPPSHPLWTAPNILLTPHVSGNYSLAYTRNVLIDIFERNLRKFMLGEKMDHVVDRKAGY